MVINETMVSKREGIFVYGLIASFSAACEVVPLVQRVFSCNLCGPATTVGKLNRTYHAQFASIESGWISAF